MSNTDATVSGLSAAMRFDHERLEIGARHVLECVLFGKADVVEHAFHDLSRELVAHLEAEELDILPGFEREHPEAAVELRRDHATIRAAVEVLGEQVSHRAARAATVRKLIELWREHGAREETSLYPWSETGVGAAESKAALEHIRAAETDRAHQKWMP
jgi:hemerythrin superfamily protein